MTSDNVLSNMTRKEFLRGSAALLGGLLAGVPARAAAEDQLVYVGTYTRTHGKGIYSFRFDPATAKLTPVTLAAESPSPSFLAVHPNRRFLYASNEHDGEDLPGKNNNVSAFAMDRKSGTLTFLNQVSCRGEGPAHIAIDHDGKGLIAANYRSGSVALLPIAPDGRLREATAFDQYSGSGPKPQQKVPHAHGAAFSPDNRFALVAAHGIDKVMVYRYDPAKGTLIANDPPFFQAAPGDGPRHVTFHPNGRVVYSLNELSSTVTVLSYAASTGTLKQVQQITTLPPDFTDTNATAQLQVDRAGKFLYASNRGHNSIAVFAIDAGSGSLRPVEHVPTQGKTPRDFSLDPTGAYLFAANQNSDNIVIFRVDAVTGKLTPTGQVIEQVPEPACVLFV
jgi:6-phosphogluconolactonase